MPDKLIRIAIIEDNRFMTQCLSMWLEHQSGCKVVGCAEDGEAGLKLCTDTRPDLALVDIQIPRLDGLDLVERIRQTLPEIRLIVMSGLMDPYTIWRVWQSGVHGYIVKTEGLETLMQALHAVMSGGVFFSSVFQDVKTAWLSKPEAFQKILSDREQDILRYVVKGWDDADIATKFNISTATVGVHRKNLRKKLDLHNDRELVAYALRWGLDGTDAQTDLKPPARD